MILCYSIIQYVIAYYYAFSILQYTIVQAHLMHPLQAATWQEEGPPQTPDGEASGNDRPCRRWKEEMHA